MLPPPLVPELHLAGSRPPDLAMYRPTDPQLSLMESRFLVSPKKRARLERSWAEAFRTHVLPLIDEEAFRACFCADNGRPNTSIRLLVGMHLLKEADDLTDEQILDALEFNLQWQHALGVEPADAHVCEKTLHNFRHLMIGNERAAAVFIQLTKALMRADGLSAVRQRLDSTHVISNIAVLSQLGLFTETVTHFLRDLRRDAPAKLDWLGEGYAERYLDREGFFADAKREEAQRRLPMVTKDLYALVRLFEADADVIQWPSYLLLVRLMNEQCDPPKAPDTNAATQTPSETEATEPPKKAEAAEATQTPTQTPAETEAPKDTEVPLPTLKDPKEVGGDSLQSPHDPDATYGHKGKGYEVQLAETCVAENPYEVITAVAVNGANVSDQHATVPIVEKLIENGTKPEELNADTAYSGGENIVACAKLGVNLIAPVQDPNKPTPTAPGEAPPVRVGTNPGGLGSFAFNSVFDNVASCPQGQAPTEQHATKLGFEARFAGNACATCPFAATCATQRRAHTDDRVLVWRPPAAATANRQREQQERPFKQAYKIRSGIESTNAEIKGRHGARKLRVRGEERVGLAMHLKALALNAKRAVQYHTDLLRTALGTVEPTLAIG